ncbi:hypothetical protein NQ314_003250 [Rhamnusium bicolor]|uniref:Uncharacterized protein n=1 Tax=Rhamnusium bicolor TaxID=1586634 RepID=A0AAV8ZM79_9CUCU|nr:hypothetical protein NQ314_003250 [Rhamnusium bicolor]
MDHKPAASEGDLESLDIPLEETIIPAPTANNSITILQNIVINSTESSTKEYQPQTEVSKPKNAILQEDKTLASEDSPMNEVNQLEEGFDVGFDNDLNPRPDNLQKTELPSVSASNILDPFERHLKFPDPLKKSVNRKLKVSFPKAISSTSWRVHLKTKLRDKEEQENKKTKERGNTEKKK